jgi:hypothetical protein
VAGLARLRGLEGAAQQEQAARGRSAGGAREQHCTLTSVRASPRPRPGWPHKASLAASSLLTPTSLPILPVCPPVYSGPLPLSLSLRTLSDLHRRQQCRSAPVSRATRRLPLAPLLTPHTRAAARRRISCTPPQRRLLAAVAPRRRATPRPQPPLRAAVAAGPSLRRAVGARPEQPLARPLELLLRLARLHPLAARRRQRRQLRRQLGVELRALSRLSRP